MSFVVRTLRVIGRWLLRNPIYKVLSVTIAILAWLYVQGGQVVEAKARVRLVWELPEDLLSTEVLPASATVTLVGPRNATRRAAADAVHLPIDLSEHSMGEVELDLGSFAVEGLPSNLQVRRIEPEVVRFVLDEVLAKKVRVAPSLIGDPAEDHQIVAVEADPPVVSIRGPRTVLDELGELDTLPVDISGLADDAVMRVELDLPRSVDLISDERLRVRIDLEPRITARTFDGVPVEVWRSPGWGAEPAAAQVILEGPTAQLARLTANDLVVFLHLPDEPDRASYGALFGSMVGPRLRVLHGGGSEVRAVGVNPPAITATRR